MLVIKTCITWNFRDLNSPGPVFLWQIVLFRIFISPPNESILESYDSGRVPPSTNLSSASVIQLLLELNRTQLNCTRHMEWLMHHKSCTVDSFWIFDLCCTHSINDTLTIMVSFSKRLELSSIFNAELNHISCQHAKHELIFIKSFPFLFFCFDSSWLSFENKKPELNFICLSNWQQPWVVW